MHKSAGEGGSGGRGGASEKGRGGNGDVLLGRAEGSKAGLREAVGVRGRVEMGLGPQGSVTTRLDGREALARDGSWRGPWRWSAALGQGRRGASAAEGGDGVGSTQGAETAVGTALRAEADEGEESVGEVGHRRGGSGRGVGLEQLSGMLQAFADVRRGVNAKVPNLGKSTGDDVLEEAAGKGERLEGGCVFALGAEGDVVVGEVEDAAVGDGDAVGVAAEVLEDLLGAAEGLLGVDDPGLSGEGLEEEPEGDRVGEMALVAAEEEAASLMGTFEGVQDLGAEDHAEGLDGEEEGAALASLARVLGAGPHPAGAVGGEAAGGDDAVRVRVVAQVAGPGVQDRGDADEAADVAAVVAEGDERLRGGPEELGVDERAVEARDGAQLGREREDDVVVDGGEDADHAALDPGALGEGLTAGAVSVAAGVVGGVDGAAVVADVGEAAERGGSAA